MAIVETTETVTVGNCDPYHRRTLDSLIERHRKIYGDLETAVDADDEAGIRALCEAEPDALAAVLVYPVRSIHDARRKAAYLMQPGRTLVDGLDGEHMGALLRSFAAA